MANDTKKITARTREAVIRKIKSGMESKRIAKQHRLSTMQVAAIRAHDTMGTYR